jgi:uncharacterized protein YceK
MKKLSFYIILSITTLIISGCSSHKDVISVSEIHYYNQDFGLVQNYAADREIQQELLSMNLPTEIEVPRYMNPEWSMELTKDSDAFYAHEYVQQAEVITYKYKFDEKFYDHAEWRRAEFD